MSRKLRQQERGARRLAGDRGRRRVIALVLVLLAAAALVALLRSPLFELESVHVRGVDRLSPDEVVDAAPVSWGEWVWAVNRRAVAESVARLPRVASVRVTMLLPNRLEIIVQEHRPVAVAAAGRLWELSAAGKVLGEAEAGDHADLPVITGSAEEPPAPGQLWADEGVQAALALLAVEDLAVVDELSEAYLGTRPDHLTLYTRDGFEVRLPAQALAASEARERLAALGAILAELRGQEVDVRYIDLRFADHPVVRRAGELPD